MPAWPRFRLRLNVIEVAKAGLQGFKRSNEHLMSLTVPWIRHKASHNLVDTLNSRRAVRTTPQRAHHVFARDHAGQPLVAFDHRHASDSMIDHELEHPRQPSVRPDIDEVRRHDIGDGLLHQIFVARDHASRGKNKAGEKIELRNQAHHRGTFLNRIGVEVVLVEQVAEFAQRDAARHGPGITRHVAGGYLFKERMQCGVRSV